MIDCRGKNSSPKKSDGKNSLLVLIFLALVAWQVITKQAVAEGISQSWSDGDLPADSGLAIAQAMVGSWEYGVYLLGLPVGLKAQIEISLDDQHLLAKSQVTHFLAANSHQSKFSLLNCKYRLHGYHNYGFSPGWRFDDTVAFDWQKKTIRYQGMTQGPKTPDAQMQTVTMPLDDAVYVDKLSQFAALACAMQGRHGDDILLSYVDDTIGRYKFLPDSSSKLMSIAGQQTPVIKVESEPYVYEEGSVHRRVTYWLAPALGYMPGKISTKLKGMRLTVKLLKTPSGTISSL